MTSRRHSRPARVVRPEPRFRLRYLLLFGLCGLLVWQLLPRGKAFWTLHKRAQAAANYALCMAGPMGPETLLSQPAEFLKLVRRRLITASENTKPFASCASSASTALGSEALSPLLRAEARDFQAFAAAVPGKHGLEGLVLSTAALGELASDAWPFERKGLISHFKPSSNAKRSAHPVQLRMPAVGSGIPGWGAANRATWTPDRGATWLMAHGTGSNLTVLHSRDLGLSWFPTSLAQPGVTQHAGRCVTVQREEADLGVLPTAFSLEFTDRGTSVQSWYGDQVRHQVELPGVSKVSSFSCDSSSALLLTHSGEGPPAVIRCVLGGGCGPLSVPESWYGQHLDVAQVEGVSVVATTQGGIVRVRSSRDFGQHWTRDVVAFDWKSQPIQADIKVPSQLVVLGSRLLLYGAAPTGRSYPVLVSEDLGASWNTPVQAKAAAGLTAHAAH